MAVGRGGGGGLCAKQGSEQLRVLALAWSSSLGRIAAQQQRQQQHQATISLPSTCFPCCPQAPTPARITTSHQQSVCPPDPPRLPQSSHRPPPLHAASMSRRYDSRVSWPPPEGRLQQHLHTRPTRTQTTKLTPSLADNHLLARRPPLPGRICVRSHLARRHRHWHPGQGRHCAGCRAQGHVEAAGAGHVGREALHSQ